MFLLPGMGRRKFRLSVHRKNKERKKCNVIALPISIVLYSFKYQFLAILWRYIPRLSVLLPLSAFTTSDAPSIQCLLDRLLRVGLPPHWVDTTDNSPTHQLTLCKLQQQPVHPVCVMFTLTVSEAFQWSLSFAQQNIDGIRNGVLAGFPVSLRTVDFILQLLSTLDASDICIGNPEQRFLEAAKHCIKHAETPSKFTSNTGTCMLVIYKHCMDTNSLSPPQFMLTDLSHKQLCVQKHASYCYLAAAHREDALAAAAAVQPYPGSSVAVHML